MELNANTVERFIQDPKLKKIARKVISQEPVDAEDALTMLQTDAILELGRIADWIRTQKHANKAYYSVNMNLNYTNICELRCPLCAFSCDEHDKEAYALSLDEIEEKAAQAAAFGVDEVHIVGGLYKNLKLDYFESLIKRIKAIKPDLFIVGFTAVEYDYFSKINNLPLAEIFKRLIKAGVNALPGGGAEIFSPHIRNRIAPDKISGERWLEVMQTAHQMGLETNATMLYNHLESFDDLVDHMSRIRLLQEKTGGFKTFVPLRFHGKNTRIKAGQSSTGYDDIRLYSTARIFLHNISHVKALWMYVGEKMAQTLLNFGVDDIGGTYFNEKVVHSAGAATASWGSESVLRDMILKSDMEPQRITADYRKIKADT